MVLFSGFAKRVAFSASLFLLSAWLGAGQVSCVTCHDFQSESSGWTSSPDPVACGDQCQNIRDKACISNCISTEGAVRAKALTPGIILNQKRGKLIVSTVLPGSPAEKAGIRPKDEIVSINGKAIQRACDISGWSIKGSEDQALLEVRQNGVNRNVHVALEPLDVLLATLSGTRSLAHSDPSLYTLGFDWEYVSDGLRVSNVLRGGRAESVEIRVGDIIVEVGSIAAHKAGESLLDRDIGSLPYSGSKNAVLYVEST